LVTNGRTDGRTDRLNNIMSSPATMSWQRRNKDDDLERALYRTDQNGYPPSAIVGIKQFRCIGLNRSIQNIMLFWWQLHDASASAAVESLSLMFGYSLKTSRSLMIVRC